jgi:hypothetical protein
MRNIIWDKAIDEWGAYAARNEKPRFKPTRQQIDDCLIVLAWCAPLKKENFKIVWLRSLDLSFTAIADIMKISRSVKHSDDVLAGECGENQFEDSILEAFPTIFIIAVADVQTLQKRFDVAYRVRGHLEHFHQPSDDVFLEGSAQHDV